MKEMKLPTLQTKSTENKSRPKILLLSDDINSTSGVGNMAREFVLNTLDRFNWVQIAAAKKHSQHGKILDLSKQAAELTGVSDAYLKLYPNNGYGDPELLRLIIDMERPDVILHFTDPRFWGWLYGMKDEIEHKYQIPIAYYAIWDNLPYPFWNIGAYESCDMILGISKQSHQIHKAVLEHYNVSIVDLTTTDKSEYNVGDVLLNYVPHGVSHTHFRPIIENDADFKEFSEFKSNFKAQHGNGMVFFWNNRNITRKHPSDLIHAFDHFCNMLDEDQDEPILIMHTDPKDPNGTDLIAVKRAIAPNRNVLFSTERLERKFMNFYYNLADVTVNVASNEGFGLSSLESLMAGTPVINNVTGGLQDQMRFEDSNGNWLNSSYKVPTNSRKYSRSCGRWAFPIYPKTQTLRGSLATPYIFEDIASIEDIVDAMDIAYHAQDSLEGWGLKGRDWVMSDEANMTAEKMSQSIADSLDILMEVWKPKRRVQLLKFEDREKITDNGIKINQ